MKKVLITAILLCTFATSYANDKVTASEGDQKVTTAKNEVSTKTVAATAAMPTCYALSCGTHCDWTGEYSGCFEGDIEQLFNQLEYDYCW